MTYTITYLISWTPFWLTEESCKKSTANKETPPNGEEFYMTAFNARSKCPKLSLPIIDISSSIKTFKYRYVSQHMKTFITWLFILKGFQSWLNRKIKYRMQCNTIDTYSNFSSRCSHKNRWLIKVLVWISQNSFKVNSYCLDYIALIKKLFPMPAPPLKNIWNGLGSDSLFFSANLQCNAYCIIKLNRCCWPSFSWEHIS